MVRASGPAQACALAAVIACWLLPAAALACSLVTVELVEYAIDASAQPADRIPPTPFTENRAFASRRKNEHCVDGTCTATTCGDSGSVELTFAAPHDDRTAQNDLGYRIEWIDGEMPQSMQAMVGPRWPLPPRITFEVGFDEITQLDATIALIAIDRAGNESSPSEPIHLVFSGCTKPPHGESCLEDAAIGCAAAPNSARAIDALVAFAALVAIRRRRCSG